MKQRSVYTFFIVVLCQYYVMRFKNRYLDAYALCLSMSFEIWLAFTNTSMKSTRIDTSLRFTAEHLASHKYSLATSEIACSA